MQTSHCLLSNFTFLKHFGLMCHEEMTHSLSKYFTILSVIKGPQGRFSTESFEKWKWWAVLVGVGSSRWWST